MEPPMKLLAVPAACSCIRPPSRRDVWARKPTRSSTGWQDAGQSWWQMLPLGPPDRYGSPYKAKSAFAAWPGLLAEPRARGLEGGGARLPRAQRGVDRATGRVRRARRARRPGPLRPRVGRAAPLRARPRREADRRRPDLRRPGSADHRAHPELFRAGAVAGTPPDAFTDKGQLWGNPLYDWPALQRRGYRWWIERLRAHLRPLRPRPRRPLPRLRLLLGGARGRAPRALRRLAARPRPRGLRRGRGRARRPGPDRGGPRRDHPGGRAPARRPRLPGMAILQYHFDPDPRLPAQPRQPPRAPGRLHGHPRPRHAARLVPARCRRTAGAASTRRSACGATIRTGG